MTDEQRDTIEAMTDAPLPAEEQSEAVESVPPPPPPERAKGMGLCPYGTEDGYEYSPVSGDPENPGEPSKDDRTQALVKKLLKNGWEPAPGVWEPQWSGAVWFKRLKSAGDSRRAIKVRGGE